MLKAAQLSARTMGNATTRLLKSIGDWKMIHKLAFGSFFSVFFDGFLRGRWLIRGQILDLIRVAIVS